jgi:hypothetical protein
LYKISLVLKAAKFTNSMTYNYLFWKGNSGISDGVNSKGSTEAFTTYWRGEIRTGSANSRWQS